MEGCVKEAIKDENATEKIEEIMKVLDKVMK